MRCPSESPSFISLPICDWRGLSEIAPGEELPRLTPAADDCMRLARKWLYECTFEHPACPSPSPTPLPKRVLGVGAGGAGFILKLVETQGQHAQYAALSHCWGRARTFQTEQSTSEAREESIGWHALPKTFQDAVTTTRNLGLHYIWIDSLCIIQDVRADWETESACMSSIYENSLLTIAATSSSADEKDFLGARQGYFCTSLILRDNRGNIALGLKVRPNIV